jgi:hypothetical protein
MKALLERVPPTPAEGGKPEPDPEESSATDAMLVLGRDKGYNEPAKKQTARKGRKVECPPFSAEDKN